jgi:hypothetical protein
MGSKAVDPDQWTALVGSQLRFYLGNDPLGARHVLDFGIDPDHDPEHGTQLLEVRSREFMQPWRMQFVYPGRLYLPDERLTRIDTEQFRAYTEDPT